VFSLYHLVLIDIAGHAAGKDDGENFNETYHQGDHCHYHNTSSQVIHNFILTTQCIEIMINEWHKGIEVRIAGGLGRIATTVRNTRLIEVDICVVAVAMGTAAFQTTLCNIHEISVSLDIQVILHHISNNFVNSVFHLSSLNEGQNDAYDLDQKNNEDANGKKVHHASILSHGTVTAEEGNDSDDDSNEDNENGGDVESIPNYLHVIRKLSSDHNADDQQGDAEKQEYEIENTHHKFDAF
jgi:hypothetical protein